jgi:hypothetical protein
MGLLIIFVTVFGIGSVGGLLVGTFFGIKNYILSVRDNINNNAFKVIMMFVTVASTIIILLYLIGIGYFLFNYLI